jgi:hypothetical protein
VTFADWLTSNRRNQAQPLSLQTTIAQLTQRLHDAEHTLHQIRLIHRADEFGDACTGCRRPWPCETFRALDGDQRDCPHTDPWTGARCSKQNGHHGLHGGMDSSGTWRSWN